jgi:hypothetical protein
VVGAAGVPVNEPPVDLKTLHAKIGLLAMENDFSYGLFLQARRAPSSLPRSQLSVCPTWLVTRQTGRLSTMDQACIRSLVTSFHLSVKGLLRS